jgi:hypothetical protein
VTRKIGTHDEFLAAVADYIENMSDWGIPIVELNGEEDIIAELNYRISWVRAHFSAVREYQAERAEKLSKFTVVK